MSITGDSSTAALRASLEHQQDLARYADTICMRLNELIAVRDDRQALLALLKGPCEVTVLGHRHRLVSHIIRAAAPSGSDVADAPAPAAAETVLRGSSATAFERSAFVASAVSQCEVFEGPLPFMTLKSMKPTGTRLPIALDYPGLHRVRAEPPIYLVEDFLTAAECASLVRCADPLLIRSKTDSGVTDQRTSRSTHLRKETSPCPSVLRKVCALTGKPVEHMEVPQVARYEPGQYYRMHFDSGDESTRAGPIRDEGGLRICTVLIYLNDVSSGGATRFPRLGIEVAPRRGAALVFFPAYTDGGGIDPGTLHEARDAVDRKYVCQVWIRERTLPEEEHEHYGVGHRLLAALQESTR